MFKKLVVGLLLTLPVAAVAAFGLPVGSKPREPAGPGSILSLRAPAFLRPAAAEALAGAGIVESEAGMSAYFQASGGIDLNAARNAFRTVETQTADYIIGSVPLPGYTEADDVHVYVHRDGWVVAYYLAQEPASRIFDWVAYHNGGRSAIGTRLESALSIVASRAGVPFLGATYYDFRYPNATDLVLIVDWTTGSTSPDSFQVKLPGALAYYERSWSLASDNYGYLYLNNTQLARVNKRSSDPVLGITQGFLSATQLPTDQYHEVRVEGAYSYYNYGGLALVYRRP